MCIVLSYLSKVITPTWRPLLWEERVTHIVQQAVGQCDVGSVQFCLGCSCVLLPTLRPRPPTSRMLWRPCQSSPQGSPATECLDLPPRLPTQLIPTIPPGPTPPHSASQWPPHPRPWRWWRAGDKDATCPPLWQLWWSPLCGPAVGRLGTAAWEWWPWRLKTWLF